MKFRTLQPDSPEVSLTALIDVVFLLLIFFMVSTTFEWRTELGIELPAASAEESEAEEAVVAPGGRQRRRPDPSSVGGHGHGCRAPGGPVSSDLRGASLRGAGTLTCGPRNRESRSRWPLAAGLHRIGTFHA